MDDPLQQLLALDAATLRARLATADPTALRQLQALMLDVSKPSKGGGAALPSGTSSSSSKRPRTPASATVAAGGAVDAVFATQDLFELILSYAVALSPQSTTTTRIAAAAAPLVKLAEVCKLWCDQSRAPLSLWLPLLRAHAPIGAADGGKAAMAWPGGASGYLKDFVRCSVGIGGGGADRFWRPELLLGVEVRDARDKAVLFAAVGGLEMWDRKEGDVAKTLVAMHAGKGAEPCGPVFTVAQRTFQDVRRGSDGLVQFKDPQHYFSGSERWWYKQVFELRVTAACKRSGRMALLLEKKDAVFTAMEDRTREGDVLLVLTTKQPIPMASVGTSTLPSARVEIRLMSSDAATAAAKRHWTGEPGGGRLVVEGTSVEALTAYIWSHVL